MPIKKSEITQDFIVWKFMYMQKPNGEPIVNPELADDNPNNEWVAGNHQFEMGLFLNKEDGFAYARKGYWRTEHLTDEEIKLCVTCASVRIRATGRAYNGFDWEDKGLLAA